MSSEFYFINLIFTIENEIWLNFFYWIYSIPENVLPEWHFYFLCGVKGVLEKLPPETTPRGFRASVYGNIPLGSGLSSSSALVSAVTLALSRAYNLTLTKEELADLAAKSERYIGTLGGGMDQAISFLATKGFWIFNMTFSGNFNFFYNEKYLKII